MRGTRTLAVLGVAAAGLAAAVGIGMHWRDSHVEAAVSGLAPLCVEASRIFCERLEACGAMDRAQRSACIEHHARDCDADIGWRIRSGTRVVDAEAREECLEGLEAASCGAVAFVLSDDEQDVFESSTRCEPEELLAPDGGLGAPCGSAEDCVTGTCPYTEPGCHACRPFASLGSRCKMGGEQCDPKRAFCKLAQGGLDGLCTALAPAGAPCSAAEECTGGVCRGVCADPSPGGGCSAAADCGPRFFCRSSADGGTCQPRIKNGQSCAAGDPCQDPEATCVGGRCQVRPFELSVGARCSAFTDCKDGLSCQNGTCVAQSEAGGFCPPGDYGGCRLTARCVSGTCVALAGQGERCGGLFQCKAELDCVPNSPDAGFAGGARCLPPGAMGDPCGPYHSCRNGLCRDSACVPLDSDGTPCHRDDECASGFCALSADAGVSRCHARCG